MSCCSGFTYCYQLPNWIGIVLQLKSDILWHSALITMKKFIVWKVIIIERYSRDQVFCQKHYSPRKMDTQMCYATSERGNVLPQVTFYFILRFISLFWERESVSTSHGGVRWAEAEGESMKHIPPEADMGSTSHPWDHNLSWGQSGLLNRESHPGASHKLLFINCGKIYISQILLF